MESSARKTVTRHCDRPPGITSVVDAPNYSVPQQPGRFPAGCKTVAGPPFKLLGNQKTLGEPIMAEQDLAAIARTIIDANQYMTLATADAQGQPWASPVFYATADYTEFYWISAPETTHSRNLAQRPEISIVIFDSTAPEGAGQAVY